MPTHSPHPADRQPARPAPHATSTPPHALAHEGFAALQRTVGNRRLAHAAGRVQRAPVDPSPGAILVRLRTGPAAMRIQRAWTDLGEGQYFDDDMQATYTPATMGYIGPGTQGQEVTLSTTQHNELMAIIRRDTGDNRGPVAHEDAVFVYTPSAETKQATWKKKEEKEEKKAAPKKAIGREGDSDDEDAAWTYHASTGGKALNTKTKPTMLADMEELISKLSGPVARDKIGTLIGGIAVKAKDVKKVAGLNFAGARLDLQKPPKKGAYNLHFQIDDDSYAGVLFVATDSQDEILAQLVESYRKNKMAHSRAYNKYR